MHYFICNNKDDKAITLYHPALQIFDICCATPSCCNSSKQLKKLFCKRLCDPSRRHLAESTSCHAPELPHQLCVGESPLPSHVALKNVMMPLFLEVVAQNNKWKTKHHGAMGREERERWGVERATAKIHERCKF